MIAWGLSYRQAAEKFWIARTVLHQQISYPNTKKHGGQVILGVDVEEQLVNRLITCANWGYPLDKMDLRLVVKGYLGSSFCFDALI